VAEVRLARFVEEMVVPPNMIDTIVDGEVNEEFLRVLQILSKKLTYVAENSTTKDYAALQDVIPEIEKLRIKAVSKVWNPTSFQPFSGCGDFGVMTEVIVAMRWQQLSLMQFGLCSLFSAVLLFNP
jgi:hypothetical protein